MPIKIHQLDPTKDMRWAELLERHPRASVFHTVGWLQALRYTYGYEPTVFTTSPPTGELKNGLVFCRIQSWLTGRRLVSLPFSDHCEPLCDSTEELNFLIQYLVAHSEHERWKSLEIRPIHECFNQADNKNDFSAASRYFLHSINLRPELDELLRSFDKDSVQRRIRRAERTGLREECGRSELLLRDFYSLFVVTRRRHHVPPIPYPWFQNLIRCLGESLDIRVAYYGESPISAILTLRFKDVVYYKYGCSDARFNKFGATPWLFWRAIVAGKSHGATSFDLGRTEEDNPGLLEFKNHWTPQPKQMVYWKFPGSPSLEFAEGWKLAMAKRVFSRMPNALLRIAGRLLYRHIG